MKYTAYILSGLFAFLLVSCAQPGPDDPGSEYMPDMAHSIAYESNYYDYYYYNTWGTESDYHQSAQPKKPVNGTVPRGYAGAALAAGAQEGLEDMSVNAIKVPTNGFVPYHYEDTEAERTRATAEIIQNPYPITADGLATGKELYNVFCATCHGEKGDGNGYLVRDDGGVYPAQPASFITDEFLAASNGRYYHAIMHGKNVMGGYADKMNYKERWEVIHWIRALQAKDQKKTYNEQENTLTTVEIPAASLSNNQTASLLAQPAGGSAAEVEEGASDEDAPASTPAPVAPSSGSGEGER